MPSMFRARHQAKRVWQTPRTFSNWPDVLAGMAREAVGRGPETLTFTTRDGLVMECPNHPGARVPIYEVFAEDCYHFSWFLGSMAGEPLQVIDVGGQIGTFTCSLAQREPKATINAYEPSPASAAVLRRNVDRNSFGNRITVVEAALSDSIGTAEFDDNASGSGHNSLLNEQGDRMAIIPDATTTFDSARATVTVATTTWDAVISALPEPPNVVKIDCEGAEYDLVGASSPENWAAVQRLVIEYHPVAGHKWKDLRAWFDNVGLSVQLEENLGEELGVAWLSREPLGRFAA